MMKADTKAENRATNNGLANGNVSEAKDGAGMAQDMDHEMAAAKMAARAGKVKDKANEIRLEADEETNIAKAHEANNKGSKDGCWNCGGGRYANQCPKGNEKVAKATEAAKAIKPQNLSGTARSTE